MLQNLSRIFRSSARSMELKAHLVIDRWEGFSQTARMVRKHYPSLKVEQTLGYHPDIILSLVESCLILSSEASHIGWFILSQAFSFLFSFVRSIRLPDPDKIIGILILRRQKDIQLPQQENQYLTNALSRP